MLFPNLNRGLIKNYIAIGNGRWKEGVAGICAIHLSDAHLINDDFVVFIHGQKLLVNAGPANDPHLVIFCRFQMRE